MLSSSVAEYIVIANDLTYSGDTALDFDIWDFLAHSTL